MADGVTHFDPFSGRVKHYKMNVDKTNPNVLLPSFVIFEDVNDILWIYPRGGGFSRYNRIDRDSSISSMSREAMTEDSLT